MKTYSLSNEAIQDLENLCDYLAQTSPKLVPFLDDAAVE
jgi:hypothetical protein